MAEDLSGLILELDEEAMLAAVRSALAGGAEPIVLVEQLRSGMTEVGSRFERKEYFLSELVMSAEMFSQAMDLIEPLLSVESAGKPPIVLGTVAGDIHDIGKNIVASLLKCDGFLVYDLGVDVPGARFVSELNETGSGLLALSGLLTPAFDEMKETVRLVEEAGLREKVRVIVGGGPVNKAVADYAGADAFGGDAAEAVRLANRYLC